MVSADAIRSVFGGREEPWCGSYRCDQGARVQLWPVPADAIDRRVSMVGTIRELLESARLLHVALNGGEPERLTAKLLLAATWPGSSSANRPRRCARSRGSRARRSSSKADGGRERRKLGRLRVSGAMARGVVRARADSAMLIDNSEAEAPPPPAAADAEYDPANPSIAPRRSAAAAAVADLAAAGPAAAAAAAGTAAAARPPPISLGLRWASSCELQRGGRHRPQGRDGERRRVQFGRKVFVRKEPLPGGERCVVVRGRLAGGGGGAPGGDPRRGGAQGDAEPRKQSRRHARRPPRHAARLYHRASRARRAAARAAALPHRAAPAR